MVVQARAELTRDRIIAAAVELFAGEGYGDTGLSEIIERARVSKGAFYYHFDSKEALAGAIIEEGTARLLTLFRTVTTSPSSALENTIAATFAIAQMTRESLLVGVSNQLRQGLGQVSAAGSPTYRNTLNAFRDEVDKAIAQGDVDSDVDAEDLAETVCVAVLGCHLVSDAIGDDLYARLRRAWRIILRGTVSRPSQRYFDDFLNRIALRYTQIGECPAVSPMHTIGRVGCLSGATRPAREQPRWVPAH